MSDSYPGEAAYLLEGDDEVATPVPTEEKPPRQTVVVDVETNGLDWERHQAVEVAWWNLDTGDRGCFVPVHNVRQVLADADIGALRITRYVDRLADAEQDREGLQLARLAEQLAGNTLAGSNVRFDSHMLGKLIPEQWHYRLLELGSYGAGVLRRPVEEGVPGLFELCALLGVEQEGDVHTAEAGVTATGNCLLELRNLVNIHNNYPQRVIATYGGFGQEVVGTSEGGSFQAEEHRLFGPLPDEGP